VIIRSFLFVPGDSEKKLAKAQSSPADALILDLEDSVAAENRPKARGLVREYLKQKTVQALWVRVNPVGTSDYRADIEAIVAGAPAGVMIPKPDSPQALRTVDSDVSVLEVNSGVTERSIRVLPVATETPTAVTTLMEYRDPPPRLWGLTWGAEDLSAAVGAATNRDDSGEFLLTYKIVRSLCLIAAKAAGVEAIETLHADFRDQAGLARAARNAQREGFSGMMAIHPDQVATINDAFTPSAADVVYSRRVVAAFAGGVGVASLDGKMLDQPHLKQARHVIALHETLASRNKN
jgi:citrate lyase subunit beta/citryl-CoA lyase